MSRTFPPNYQLWVDLYGRPLTSKDSVDWEKNNRKLLYQLESAFFVNRHVTPDGEDALISDSLVRELNKFFIDNTEMGMK